MSLLTGTASGTSVTLGNFHDCYTLSATLERAEGTDKIKIVPVYTVKNHKKAAGGPDTVTPEIKYSSFTHLKTQLTKDYFTEEKVFQYVLEQTVNDNAIKADPNEFASSFYNFHSLYRAWFIPMKLFLYERNVFFFI